MTPLYALLFSADESRGGGDARRAADLLGMPEACALEQLRAGDEGVYARIYAVLFPRLVAIARGYVPAAVAEEIAQDALLLLWTRRAEWPAEQGITVRLYTVARRRAIDQARHHGVIGRLEGGAAAGDDPVGVGAPPPAPDEAVEREDLAAAITRALGVLPERARTAFTLRWVHQLGYPEVADVMGISEVAARKQVSRAREALVGMLEAYLGR